MNRKVVFSAAANNSFNPTPRQQGLAWQKERPPELITATFVNIVVAHTGHSSQLFPVTFGRNAKFLATVGRDALMVQIGY